jgi:hypothetical protein
MKQPGGDLYAVFSEGTGTWILFNATREDIITYYADRAAADARESATRLLARIDANPRRAYYQFTMTFAEANAESIDGGGKDLHPCEDGTVTVGSADGAPAGTVATGDGELVGSSDEDVTP